MRICTRTRQNENKYKIECISKFSLKKIRYNRYSYLYLQNANIYCQNRVEFE